MLLSVDKLHYSRGAHILQKSRSHPKILDARSSVWKILTTMQSLDVMAT